MLVFLALMGLLGFAWVRMNRSKAELSQTLTAPPQDSAYNISYAPPEFEWSGTTTGALPLKILTYKQYECLEDARYGFRIVGVPPSDRKQPQPHKTRAHGVKTVASLHKHGFLDADGSGGYVITDHGLNALEVCNVRY
ncbi:MAG: hypothetical protein Q8O29_10895 [Polaromonas sp.]|uniref:hypothetical protein n=1 Tax=Polaromonas sp. TaxID=1869339 RepID=UPI0027359557|nr:hypothetical protein [Polaromonas sp.]MDP2818756.1 hypothetical protein [Polaromonas sp.]